MYELVRHSGKIHSDYVNMVVDSASKLADKLNLGVTRKPTTRKTELVNIVEAEAIDVA